jgi:hypothetical protein
MEQSPPQPKKPGWYWDPAQLDYNLALRQRWRNQIILTERQNYRLRRWNGRAWTDDTLDNYGARMIPHTAGPTTRIFAVTPAQQRIELKIWAVLMGLACLAALVFEVVK